MKLQMTFELPEETDVWEMYSNAPKYYNLLHRLREEIRSRDKYGDDIHVVTWGEVHKMFWDLLTDEGVDLL